MKKHQPRRLEQLLGQGSLGKIATEARSRQGLVAEIRRALPDDEAAELLAASREPDGTLVLTMTSPAWAARVRYRAKDLGVTQLRVKVIPHT